MKIYKVEVERLSFDWGRFQGWNVVGYYTSKAKAERISKESANKDLCTGQARITEISVDTEEN